MNKFSLHFVLIRLVWFFVKSLISTFKFRFPNQEVLQSVREKGAFVFAVWHESVIGYMSAHAWTEPYLSLASRSKDGDYAAFISEKMGFVSVRGSSKKRNKDKGGREAMEEYIQKMGQGISGGITVDGPKGPRHECKMGIVKIAQLTGRPILPGAALPSRYWTVNSWDKFKIPKPFATITIKYGDPVWVPQEATPEQLEEARLLVQTRLKGLYEQV